MKRQIRRSVFETNSSSMHSLVIMKKNERYTPEEISRDIYLYKDKETGEKCIWEPYEYNMNFGRSPFKALGTFKSKWLYACASLVYEYNDDTYKELLAIALKYVPGLKKIKLPTIGCTIPNIDNKDGKTEEQLIKYLTDKEKEWQIGEIDYWETSSGYWRFSKPYTGSVDENILSGFLKKEGITIEEYLTNKKYVVIQDGDEYCEYKNMKETGLINMDAIDHEYPEKDYEYYI